VAETVYVII